MAAQQCYKLSNVHPPTSYEVRGSPLTAPTLAFLPPVLAYCCSRGLLFTIVVHQGYCCSVVTVNNNNTVQKLTFGNSKRWQVALPSIKNVRAQIRGLLRVAVNVFGPGFLAPRRKEPFTMDM